MTALIGVSTITGEYHVESCRKLPSTTFNAVAQSAVEPLLMFGRCASEVDRRDTEIKTILFDAGKFGVSELVLRRIKASTIKML